MSGVQAACTCLIVQRKLCLLIAIWMNHGCSEVGAVLGKRGLLVNDLLLASVACCVVHTSALVQLLAELVFACRMLYVVGPLV